tara:strand:+ start:7754 stop:8020 length:267 start_codon:yes stop_codon:yes gene_type:complete
MIDITTKTEVITKNTHIIKTELTLDELKTIQTALYETDKEGNLLHKIGNVVRDAQSKIIELNRSIERNVTQDEVIAAQSGVCNTGNCD